MKFVMAVVLMCSLMVLSVGCTAQQQAKKYGGKMTITLPTCEKLVTSTWKESNMWYLTRPMRADEKPETYSFKENSSFGVLEGTVVFVETCNR